MPWLLKLFPIKIDGLLTALAFYTCLAPASARADAALAWNGAAGLLLGAAITLPPYAITYFQHGWITALLAAWLWLTLEIRLTRGLHWDAVADLGDAVGSGANGKNFWFILKDSRMGAFGGMSLYAFLTGQLLAAASHFATTAGPAVSALILAPAFARLGPAWLGRQASAYATNSLGALICARATRKIWVWAWLQGICFAFIPCLFGLAIAQALLLLAAQSGLNCWFGRLAREHGGLSGDFFGCHIEASQLLFLLLTLPAQV